VGILSRTVFFEILGSASLGALLFLFVLFLQKAGRIFSILVASTTTPDQVGYLFLLLLPAAMPLTIPLGVLVGVLIALSRMSSDGEITAIRASGIPSRRLALPVTAFALVATGFTAWCSLWLTPLCNAEMVRVINRMGAAQLTAEIQPRVFEESFPNRVLYVSDVLPGQPVRWRTVFMADLTPPEKRQGASEDKGDGPAITIAPESIVSADMNANRLQMSMPRGATYEAGKDPQNYYTVEFSKGEQVLEAQERKEHSAKAFTATPTGELFRYLGESMEARIEMHSRFALPLACLLLALLGIPLGASTRKGGKPAAFVITVSLAFLYYLGLVSMIGLAQEGRLPAAVAVWTPNALFAVLACLLLLRLESPGDRDWFAAIRQWLAAHWERFRVFAERRAKAASSAPGPRLFFLPLIIDTYILTNFLFYFAGLLLSFVLLTEVFNFFELLGDSFRTQTPMREMLQYLLFLAPKLIYDAAPVSVLVAVLVTFGILAKSNEITALKACGVSLYRLSLPVLVACLALSGSLFAFDHYVVTGANLVQDHLRNRIKGRAVQTYLNPNRHWIRGNGPRIFYYIYFNGDEGLLGGVHVYDIDEANARLKRHIYAERARWEPALNTWIFQNGWSRDFSGRDGGYQGFQGGAMSFNIAEPPSWFAKEVKTSTQMTHDQLASYISELQQSGFNTVPLQVQYHKKFSLPLFALVMALLSVPFSFLTGSRGAMMGVGVSLGIAIAYFAMNQLFEQLGNVHQLPPSVAAWAPGVLFALAGGFLMTRMRT
jgi:LPS export ABC transporter permease LptG/LPS export ABC transporter permease LptF